MAAPMARSTTSGIDDRRAVRRGPPPGRPVPPREQPLAGHDRDPARPGRPRRLPHAPRPVRARRAGPGRGGGGQRRRRPAATSARSATCGPRSWTSTPSRPRDAAPLADDLAAIRAGRARSSWSPCSAASSATGRSGLVEWFVDNDGDDATRYVVNLVQAGLGLPDEAYYREDAYAEIRAAYVEHVGDHAAPRRRGRRRRRRRPGHGARDGAGRRATGPRSTAATRSRPTTSAPSTP